MIVFHNYSASKLNPDGIDAGLSSVFIACLFLRNLNQTGYLTQIQRCHLALGLIQRRRIEIQLLHIRLEQMDRT
jgi:hypothetical protein